MPSTFERGFVKVCGVTNVADATMAASAGANAIGLILAESPRRVTLEQASEIAARLKGEILRIVVFRHQEDDVILEHLDALDVDAVQVHATLSPSLLAALRERPLLVVKALAIDGDEFDDFDESRVDAVLVDGPRPGSGVAHSWERLRLRNFCVPVIAAGGLNPANVADVIRSTNPWGVDSASGLERSPGRKDRALVERYVANARDAFVHLGVT
ncbi:MAG TPA: phosphoribosylanthranilate isomerase [Acidimicrobiales bacterium]|nr:phosphoribosylanthranilate isomerase [Acidimicrobiales bacterium]